MKVPPHFWLLLSFGASSALAEDAASVAFFESKIRPVLIEHCYKCHSVKEGKSKGGLLLDSREGLQRGGDTGPAVVPGDLEKSLLIHAVRHTDDDMQMPPKKKLPDAVVEDLEKWVAAGATDPRDGKSVGTTTINIEEGRKHWSFQPISNPPVPAVKDTQWPRTDIDRFVLAALEAKGLKPVADAAPEVLRRRMAFDLTGLPPQDSQVPNSSAEVERLLASPHYGERWGRHWLDIAGYSESSGGGQNMVLPVNYRYRDYVISAFNQDKPYDQFVREQIAGDLMPAGSDAQRNQQLVATGFLSIGTKDTLEQSNERYIMAVVDEQLDSMGRALMGLTLGCAKCHDHKFDPIPARDYYALAGIMRSSEPLAGAWRRYFGKWTSGVQPLAGKPAPFTDSDLDQMLKVGSERMSLSGRIHRAKRAAVLAAHKENENQKALDEFYKTSPEVVAVMSESAKLNASFKELIEKLNLLLPNAASAMRDIPKPADCAIRIRGEEDQLGEVVPRGFPEVLTTKSTPKVNPAQSGRLELAQWLTNHDNPLVARVMVNRIWLHLFGTGIVESPDDFGKTGQPPSNTALLDHLAQRFIAHQWSVKALIREIMSSRVYQLSSAHSEMAYASDPANRLNWRMNRRRLDADAIRDALLNIGDQLTVTPPPPSVHLRVEDPRVKSASKTDLLGPTERHRTVYRTIMHEIVPDDLSVFDFPEPTLLTGKRSVTTVPTQALFMMNSPLVVEQSKHTAERILAGGSDDRDRASRTYQLMLNRAATSDEIAETVAFVHGYPSSDADKEKQEKAAWAAFCQTLFASAEFRYLY